MTRKSARQNKGKLPEHLKDYQISGQSTTMDSPDQDDLDETVRNGNDLDKSLSEQVSELQKIIEDSERERQELKEIVLSLRSQLQVNVTQAESSSNVTNENRSQNVINLDGISTANAATTDTIDLSRVNVANAIANGTATTSTVNTTSLHANPIRVESNITESTSNSAQCSFVPQSYHCPIPSHSITPSSSINLHPRKLIDLPEFDGSPDKWPIFYVSFTETTNTYGYTNLENLSRLQKSLKGIAKQRVEALLIHPNNVLNIISSLKLHFGRPEQLIKSQIFKVRAFPVINECKPNELVNFSIMVTNLTAFLETSGAATHLANPTLLDELLMKLPQGRKEEWLRYVNERSIQFATIKDFSSWLQTVSTYVAMAIDLNNNKPVQTGFYERKARSVSTINEKPQILKCVLCNSAHALKDCQSFKDLSVSERWERIKGKRICYSCLKHGHMSKECRAKRECGIDRCKHIHNRLLHNKNLRSDGIQEATQSESLPVANIQNLDLVPEMNQEKVTVSKFIPVTLYGPKGSVDIVAFIDEGAKVSLLEEQVANEIGIKGPSDILSLKWIGNKTTKQLSSSVHVDVSEKGNSKVRFQMKNVRTIKQLLLPPQSLNISEMKKRYPIMNNISLQEYENSTPKLLIGLPHSNIIRPLEIINFDNGFSLHRSKLGWTFFGSNEEQSPPYVCLIDTQEELLDEIEKQVSEYFSLENMGVKPIEIKQFMSKEDKRAEQILIDTSRKIGDRYETGLIWRKDKPELGSSYEMALRRLCCVERKMSSDKAFSDWYKNKMNEIQDKSYARKLSPIESAKIDKQTWYLPHFAVCNINKGNKLRLVFDAAARVNGMSLNDNLNKGPNKYQPPPLLTVLFKFRQRKIGICGDIREMFNQVKIIEQDQSAQRFLWRNGQPESPPDVYVMTSMIFGSTCSPCSAQYIKNLNAIKFKNEHPEAVKAIIDLHYVDDYVASWNSEMEAKNITKTIIDIHREAGFELRGFVSNSQEVLKALCPGNINREQPKPTNFGNCNDSEKILGMHWDPNADEFCFMLSFKKIPTDILEGNERPTKRQVLGMTMAIFDPYGFLANIVVSSKLLLQDLWRLKCDWNEKIPENIFHKWYKWYSLLKEISKVRIPRCYSLSFADDNVDIQLHIFVDASEEAYACVAYWRIQFEYNVEVIFVAGKSRCSPLKPVTIPRLELQAAVIGVRLKETIINSHDIKPKRVILWTDSKTVLHWINSDGRTFKQFVANRISEIHELSRNDDWKWVPGKENPADEATRFHKAPLERSIWLKGPPFLKNAEEEWPTSVKEFKGHDDLNERKSTTVYAVEIHTDVIPFSKYSNYYKFLKVMCWVHLAINIWKGRESGIIKEINADIIKTTEAWICGLVQSHVYKEEIHCLKNNMPLRKGSSIYKLTPIIVNDVLRLGGRIDKANYLPLETRRPIILPCDHPLTRLIVRYYHERFHHRNHETVICNIRTKFWIPRIRRLVKQARNTCQVCKNSATKPINQLMGQLPEDRLTPYVRPFTYTGLDYFGPVNVSIGRRKEKRWVALFTCLTIRAVHLELARDLSADAAIICLRNFINRRGLPVRIRSDCGTNFIAASKETWVIVADNLKKECNKCGIDWQFNTPANPAAGGIWERMVRSVKNVLMFSLKEKAPQIETLQSLLIEAENIVNSRPLTHLPLECKEDEPLTPNHFILGCANQIQTPEVSPSTCLRKQWHILQQLKQSFWKRWILEYLPDLARRTKWYEKTANLQVGDIVILCEPSESIGSWRRGIITKVYQSSDGQVRSALVKTQTGTIKRPTSKLAKLDCKS